MNLPGIIEVLQTALGALALFVFWHFCWKRYALDKFRQELFLVRDELFDVALEGKTQGFHFDCPAYGQLRRQIHASIRFAHRVNTLQILMFMIFRAWLFRDVPLSDRKIDHEQLLRHADDSVQSEVMGVLEKWDNAVISYLMRTSPLYYVMWFVLFAKIASEAIRDHKQNAPNQARCEVSSVVWTDVALADATEGEGKEAPLVFA